MAELRCWLQTYCLNHQLDAVANGGIILRGVQITAGNNSSFDTARYQLSSQSGNQQNGTRKSGSGSVGVGFGLGGSQNGFTVEIAASAARGEMQGKGTTHQATQVEAGNQLSLTSGRDTTLQGAQAMGDSVLADIGRDLTLTSSQDRQYYDQKDQNNRGENLNLIVSPRTETVTRELREAVESTGGKIYRYDPKTGVLTEFE